MPKWFRLYARATKRTNNLSIILWKPCKKSDDNFIANKENDKIFTFKFYTEYEYKCYRSSLHEMDIFAYIKGT